MTPDERQQLHEQAASLCYEAIVLDHLGQEPKCRDDELAEEMAGKVMVYLRGLLDEEWDRVDREKEVERVAREEAASYGD